MDDKIKALAQNIRFLRKKKGLNQLQLADKLDIKRSNIAAYETKNVEPRLRIILEMAKFFNVDLKTFIEEKINDESLIKGFESTIENPTGIEHINISKKEDVESFIEKSMKIRKILIGFKTFYSFRKTKIKQVTPAKDKIMSDIDNFIMLIEHMLSHNEIMIKAISSKQEE